MLDYLMWNLPVSRFSQHRCCGRIRSGSKVELFTSRLENVIVK